ncbi:hypothetical protein [Paenibacillus hunanensis]|uniref:Uncharacterized protein n=1 Tax=Paenibacillus hunanensis TaxID=539262 RepID=A0ABU1J0G2_9BACL|nr:hypothetical protein [Paenibacillus hunanensis]MDR6244997.1 hypothetical protein [Paenibacillus hunanensis]GGI95915.1 hypothetical protein GCM10008022_00490 [Paenibacillus hunanensis]
MYKELDEFITECQYMVDYWYDVGCIIAVEKLAQFNATDWEELQSNIGTKTLEWRVKLAYCLDHSCNAHELETLLLLIHTDDRELFESCIDTLRSFTTPESKAMILNHPSILQRIQDILPQAGVATQKVLEDFFKQLYV